MNHFSALRCLAVLTLSCLLVACGGGGGGTSGGANDGVGTRITIGGAAWTSPATAGSALSAAPDGTSVELVSWDSGSASVLARTTVSAGRYQFTEVSPPAGLSSRTMIRLVLGSQTLRALATQATTDVSPITEAVLASLPAGQQQGDGTLTPDEYGNLFNAAATLTELARRDPVNPLLPGVTQIVNLLDADSAFRAYKAATASAGTAATGVGDVGNLYPAEVGHRWQYVDPAVGVNQAGGITPLVIAAKVNRAGHADALRFDAENFSVSSTYRYKDSTGVYNLGAAGGDTVSQAVLSSLGSQLQVPFPLVVGKTHATANIADQVLQTDLDGDGKFERYSATGTLTVNGFDIVDAMGESRSAVKLTSTLTATATLSRDGSVGTLTIVNRFWLVRDLGVVRSETSTVVQHPLLNASTSNTAVLLAHAFPGSGTVQFANGEWRDVPLTHEMLLADPPRNRVLATLPAASAAQGKALAVIDMASGQVQTTTALNIHIGTVAVAADGAILVAEKLANYDCRTVGEVLRLNAATLQVESRTTIVRPSNHFCDLGTVVHIHPLPDGSMLVQTLGSGGGTLLHYVNGVQSGTTLEIANTLTTPLVAALPDGGSIYLLDQNGSVETAPFNASGFGPGSARQIASLAQLPWKPWIDAAGLHSNGQILNLQSMQVSAPSADWSLYGLGPVPGDASLGATSIGGGETLGRFVIYDLATFRPLQDLQLPWAPAVRSTMPNRAQVISRQAFAASVAVDFSLPNNQYDHIYLVRSR